MLNELRQREPSHVYWYERTGKIDKGWDRAIRKQKKKYCINDVTAKEFQRNVYYIYILYI